MKLLELSSLGKKISSNLDEAELLRLLKSEARNSYDAIRRQPIFTKTETAKPFFIVDPTKSARTSKFIIDELVTLLPSWRGWASRLNSVRGWTSRSVAESRSTGQLCLLIPFDKARVHSAPETSFYRSFAKASSAMEVEKVDNTALFAWLESLCKLAKMADVKFEKFSEPATAAQFMKLIAKLETVRHEVVKFNESEFNGSDRQHLRRALSFFSGKLPEVLSRILDPDDNGFHTYTSLYNLPENKEVWTSSKCIVLTVEEYEAIYKRGSIK